MFKDYTMNQLVLLIDLEVSLQENDIAFHIHHLVESIPKEAFRPFFKNNGCPAYDHDVKNYFMWLYAISFFWKEN